MNCYPKLVVCGCSVDDILGINSLQEAQKSGSFEGYQGLKCGDASISTKPQTRYYECTVSAICLPSCMCISQPSL